MLNLLEFGPVAFFWLLGLAAQVSGYTSPFVAALLVGVGVIWLCISLAYKLRQWHRQQVLKGELGVQPSHLILIGAVGTFLFAGVLLGGVLWQQFWWHPIPSNAATGISAPRAAGAFAAPKAAAPTVGTPKFYTDRDRGGLLDALHDASDLVNSQFEPIRTALNSAAQDKTLQTEGPTQYAADLQRLRNDLQNNLWPTVSDFRDKHKYYAQEMYSALAIDNQVAVTPQVDALIKAVGALPHDAPEKSYKLVEPQFLALEKASKDFSHWVDVINNNIQTTRATLSQGGTGGAPTQRTLAANPAPPKFTTQYDREQFSEALGELSQLLNNDLKNIVVLAENSTGTHPLFAAGRGSPDQTLQILNQISSDGGALSPQFLGSGLGAFFDKYPAYKDTLLSVLPSDAQRRWDTFNSALDRMIKAVRLVQGVQKTGNPELFSQAVDGLDPVQNDFNSATGSLRAMINESNAKIAIYAKAN